MNNMNAPADARVVAALQTIEAQILQGQLREAAAQLNLLQKSTPHDPRLYLLGSLLAERSNQADALYAAAWRAHELAPNWYVATFRVAQALAMNDQHTEAVKCADLALVQASNAPISVRLDIQQKAADMAIQAAAYDKALIWLEGLSDMDDRNPIPLLQKAQILAHTSRQAEALPHFERVLQKQPEHLDAIVGHLLCAKSLGLEALVESDIRRLQLLAKHHPVADFHVRVALGERPPSLPSPMISQLFDTYAHQFNHHAVVRLKYQLPKIVAEHVQQWHPDKAFNLLDLGCGTGLLGACIGKIDGAMVGVDLSSAMIEKAARLGVYDRFHHVNIHDALHHTPDHLYQVITALDVMGYLGELTHVLPNAARILTPGGRFVFSCEALSKGRSHYAIDPTSFRYQHAKQHVVKLAQKSGFDEIQDTDIALREENGQPVMGYLIVARKAVAAQQ